MLSERPRHRVVEWALRHRLACVAVRTNPTPPKTPARARYAGVLRQDDVELWRCAHPHRTREEALRCVQDEQRRRYLTGEDPPS